MLWVLQLSLSHQLILNFKILWGYSYYVTVEMKELYIAFLQLHCQMYNDLVESGKCYFKYPLNKKVFLLINITVAFRAILYTVLC